MEHRVSSAQVPDNGEVSVQEMREKLKKAFKDTGVVNDLKARLRTQFISNLKQKKNDSEKSLSLTDRLVHSLVAEHLRGYNLGQTLIVFLPESGLNQQSFSIEDVLEGLGVNRESRLFEYLVGPSREKENCGDPAQMNDMEEERAMTLAHSVKCSILSRIVEEMGRRSRSTLSNISTQTEVSGPGRPEALALKLDQINREYDKRIQLEQVEPSARVQEKMLQYRREIESGFEQRVSEEVARIRDREILEVKMEEASKFRIELERIRKDLQADHLERLESLHRQEAENRRRAEESMHAKEQAMFEERQKLLRDMDKCRAREQEVRRMSELEQRSIKLEEMRLKDLESAVHLRLKEVAKREHEVGMRLQEEMEKLRAEFQRTSERNRQSLAHERSFLEEEMEKTRAEREGIRKQVAEYEGIRKGLTEAMSKLHAKDRAIAELEVENSRIQGNVNALEKALEDQQKIQIIEIKENGQKKEVEIEQIKVKLEAVEYQLEEARLALDKERSSKENEIETYKQEIKDLWENEKAWDAECRRFANELQEAVSEKGRIEHSLHDQVAKCRGLEVEIEELKKVQKKTKDAIQSMRHLAPPDPFIPRQRDPAFPIYTPSSYLPNPASLPHLSWPNVPSAPAQPAMPPTAPQDMMQMFQQMMMLQGAQNNLAMQQQPQPHPQQQAQQAQPWQAVLPTTVKEGLAQQSGASASTPQLNESHEQPALKGATSPNSFEKAQTDHLSNNKISTHQASDLASNQQEEGTPVKKVDEDPRDLLLQQKKNQEVENEVQSAMKAELEKELQREKDRLAEEAQQREREMEIKAQMEREELEREKREQEAAAKKAKELEDLRAEIAQAQEEAEQRRIEDEKKFQEEQERIKKEREEQLKKEQAERLAREKKEKEEKARKEKEDEERREKEEADRKAKEEEEKRQQEELERQQKEEEERNKREEEERKERERKEKEEQARREEERKRKEEEERIRKEKEKQEEEARQKREREREAEERTQMEEEDKLSKAEEERFLQETETPEQRKAREMRQSFGKAMEERLAAARQSREGKKGPEDKDAKPNKIVLASADDFAPSKYDEGSIGTAGTLNSQYSLSGLDDTNLQQSHSDSAELNASSRLEEGGFGKSAFEDDDSEVKSNFGGLDDDDLSWGEDNSFGDNNNDEWSDNDDEEIGDNDANESSSGDFL